MSPEETKQEDTRPNYTTVEKVVKTLFLILAWVSIGLQQEITGTTLKDLIIKTNSNYELITRAVSGKSAGYFVAAIIGGPAVDKLGKYCDLIIALCLVCAAVALCITPFCPNVTVLWLLMFIRGMCGALQNIAGQIIGFNLWQEKSAGPIHILHFGYGVGSFIVPQIANPFLAIPSAVTENNTTNITNVSSSSPSESPVYYDRVSRIEFAYLIVAIIISLVSVVFVVYQFCFRRNLRQIKHKKDERKLIRRAVALIDPGTCANGNRCLGVQTFVLLFCFYFTGLGLEKLVGSILRSYAIDQLHFSGDDASLLNTIFWISFTTGRFIGLFTGTFIPIDILILLETSCLLVTTILLEIFALENVLALWILTVALGLCIAPLYPSGMAWGNFHIKITGSAITFIILGASLGDITSMWIIGYLYEHHGYAMFVHQALVFSGMLLCFTIVMTVVGKMRGGRFKTTDIELHHHHDNRMD